MGEGSVTSAVLGLLVVGGVGGAIAARLVWLRSDLSPQNWYLALAVASALLVVSIAAALPPTLILLAGLLVIASAVGSLLGFRWRQQARGAAGELKEHEDARRLLWRAPKRPELRRRIGSQGELITERRWPDGMPYVPMGAGDDLGRVPRGQGRHVLVLGGTGSGKTVSAGRITAGRVLADHVPAFVLDPKGDEDLYEQLRELARYRGVPFVVFDPFDPESDRWDPLWSPEPGRTVARVLSPIETSEPYYADQLRIHLGVVAEALAVLGLWPASMPLLLEAAQTEKFAAIRDLVSAHGAPPEIARRIEEQAAIVFSKSGERDIASGAARLRVVAGTSWRDVLNPRDDRRAVQLPAALRAGAIVLWRTWVEDIPEEAEAITTLALADAIAAAAEIRGEGIEWLVIVDEFGSVLTGKAARRALGILGRARTAGGQAVIVTQSAADVPTATENPSMLESLSDNFGGFVIHRQTSAESREWVAKLFGTREMWQSTDRTSGGGRFAEGTGSRRRAREFVVRPDELKEVGVGQAYVWAPSGPPPALVDVAIPPRLVERPEPDNEAAYADAGPRTLGEYRGLPSRPRSRRKPTTDSAPGTTAPAAADQPESERPRRIGRRLQERF